MNYWPGLTLLVKSQLLAQKQILCHESRVGASCKNQSTSCPGGYCNKDADEGLNTLLELSHRESALYGERTCGKGRPNIKIDPNMTLRPSAPSTPDPDAGSSLQDRSAGSRGAERTIRSTSHSPNSDPPGPFVPPDIRFLPRWELGRRICETLIHQTS
jgi:hypothetical protein